MNLQQLTYLVALDTYRQFGAAAEKSHVTQPALSVQIQKLEEELGILLFDRTKKGAEPTALGIKVIAQARCVLREAQQLRELVQVEKGEMVGELRLGIIPTLAPYLVPRFLVPFTAAYPLLRIHVEELRSEEIIQQLRDHRLDVGLLVTPLDDRHLRELPVLEEPFLAFVAASHPLAGRATVRPADLHQPGLWLMQQGHCFRQQVLNLCELTADPAAHLTYESGSIETLKELVRRQHGYTVVPERLVGYARLGPAVRRELIIAIDQSASMGDSIVYASVFGAALASIRSLRTRLIAFDTSVADLSETMHDPVDLLFGVQLGGGTDLAGAMSYCQSMVDRPDDTVLVLISDLYEGTPGGDYIARLAAMARSGVRCVALLALSDEGAPSFDHTAAEALASLGIPSFACTPDAFPDLIAAAIERRDLRRWAGDQGLVTR